MNEMRQAQVVEEMTFKRAFERCVREKYVAFSGPRHVRNTGSSC